MRRPPPEGRSAELHVLGHDSGHELRLGAGGALVRVEGGASRGAVSLVTRPRVPGGLGIIARGEPQPPGGGQ